MTNYQHLIIGGGMTAAAAVEGIREVDSTGVIGLISSELDAPYDRPPIDRRARSVHNQGSRGAVAGENFQPGGEEMMLEELA